MSLKSLEKRLTERVEKEIEESGKDLEFAAELMGENPEIQKAGSSVMRSSVTRNLLKAGLVIGAVYGAWSFLSLQQFGFLGYLVVGLLTAKVSEYSMIDWRAWFTTVFWLPVLVYGMLPDGVRLDK